MPALKIWNGSAWVYSDVAPSGGAPVGSTVPSLSPRTVGLAGTSTDAARADHQHGMGITALLPADVPSSYPLGQSSFYSSSGDGWPGTSLGTIVTVRLGSQRVAQTYTDKTTGQTYTRAESAADTWTAWFAPTAFTPTAPVQFAFTFATGWGQYGSPYEDCRGLYYADSGRVELQGLAKRTGAATGAATTTAIGTIPSAYWPADGLFCVTVQAASDGLQGWRTDVTAAGLVNAVHSPTASFATGGYVSLTGLGWSIV